MIDEPAPARVLLYTAREHGEGQDGLNAALADLQARGLLAHSLAPPDDSHRADDDAWSLTRAGWRIAAPSLGVVRDPNWRVVRAFVSSPFRDFHAERAVLGRVQAAVNDALRDESLEVALVDLRWGLIASDEPAAGNPTGEAIAQRCLESVRASDIFVGWLGGRYGTSRARASNGDAARSITHLEIAAALERAGGAFGCVFYLFDDDEIDPEQRDLRELVRSTGRSVHREYKRTDAEYLERLTADLTRDLQRLARALPPPDADGAAADDLAILGALRPRLASRWDVVNVESAVGKHGHREICIPVTDETEDVAAQVFRDLASRRRSPQRKVAAYSGRLQSRRLLDCVDTLATTVTGVDQSSPDIRTAVRRLRDALTQSGCEWDLYVSRIDLIDDLPGRAVAGWLAPRPDNVALFYSTADAVPAGATRVELDEPSRAEAREFVFRQAERHGKTISTAVADALVAREIGVKISVSLPLKGDPVGPEKRGVEEETVHGYMNPRWVELATGELIAADRRDILELAARPFEADARLIEWIDTAPSKLDGLVRLAIERAVRSSSSEVLWLTVALLAACRRGLRLPLLHRWVSHHCGRAVPRRELLAIQAQLADHIRRRPFDEHWELSGDLLVDILYPDKGTTREESRLGYARFAARSLLALGSDRSLGNTLDCLDCALRAGDHATVIALVEAEGVEHAAPLAWAFTAYVDKFKRRGGDRYELLSELLEAAGTLEAAAMLARFFAVGLFSGRGDEWNDTERASGVLAPHVQRFIAAAEDSDAGFELGSDMNVASVQLLRLSFDGGSHRGWHGLPADLSPDEDHIALWRMIDARCALAAGDLDRCRQLVEASRPRTPLLELVAGALAALSGGEGPTPAAVDPLVAAHPYQYALAPLLQAQLCFARGEQAGPAIAAAFDMTRAASAAWPESPIAHALYQLTHLLRGDIAREAGDVAVAWHQYVDAEEVLQYAVGKGPTASQILLHVGAALRLLHLALLRADARRAARAFESLLATVRHGYENGYTRQPLHALALSLDAVDGYVSRAFEQANTLDEDEWNAVGAKVERSLSIYRGMWRSDPETTQWNLPLARARCDRAVWLRDSGDRGRAVDELAAAARLLEVLDASDDVSAAAAEVLRIARSIPVPATVTLREDAGPLSDALAQLAADSAAARRPEVDAIISLPIAHHVVWASVLDPFEAYVHEPRGGPVERAEPRWASAAGEFLRTARYHTTSGQHRDAATLSEQAVELLRRTCGEDDAQTLKAEAALAGSLHQLGELEDARRLREHVLAARRGALGDEHLDTAWAMSDLAATLRALGELDEARALDERVIDVRRDALGDDHIETLAAFAHLAATLSAQGDLEAACRLGEHAVASIERTHGPDRHETVRAVANLAAQKAALGALDEAHALQERAVSGLERLLGAEHPETLGATCGLARILVGLGELDAARVLQERVLSTQRRLLGDEHPETLAAMRELAETLGEQGEPRQALELQELALAAYRRSLGAEHAETIAMAREVAATLRDLGALRRAYDLQADVLAHFRRVRGDDQPDTVDALEDLAFTLHRLGDLQAARELEEQVVARRTQQLGDDHPDTLVAVGNLAATLRDQGELDAAREFEERVLAGRTRLLGEHHPDVLSAMVNLAATLGLQGELEAARDLEREVVSRRREVLGDDDRYTIRAMASLASTIGQLGEYDEQRQLEEHVLAAFQRQLGEDHPDTLMAMGNLAATLRVVGELDQARTLSERVLSARTALFGSTHPETLIAIGDLARTLNEQDELDEACALQEQALAGFEAAFGGSHRYTVTARADLAWTLNELGQLERARELRDAVVATLRDQFGDEHPETLAAVWELAWTLEDLDELDAARALRERVVLAYRRIYGDDHPDTVAALSVLED